MKVRVVDTWHCGMRITGGSREAVLAHRHCQAVLHCMMPLRARVGRGGGEGRGEWRGGEGGSPEEVGHRDSLCALLGHHVKHL